MSKVWRIIVETNTLYLSAMVTREKTIFDDVAGSAQYCRIANNLKKKKRVYCFHFV